MTDTLTERAREAIAVQHRGFAAVSADRQAQMQAELRKIAEALSAAPVKEKG